jgi:ElaB/YqjD/DUF883 family membrane-anchored ribosome-binding protein
MTFPDDVSEEARARAAEFAAGVRDKVDEVRRRSLDDLWQDAADYVKENPGKAILASVAVGLLLGRLLRRK